MIVACVLFCTRLHRSRVGLKARQSLFIRIACSSDRIHIMMDIFEVALEDSRKIGAEVDAGVKLAPSQDIAGTEGARKDIV